MITSHEQSLWNLLGEYREEGPELTSPTGLALFEGGRFADAVRENRVGMVKDDQLRVELLEHIASLIMIVRLMEEVARDDDQTLIELVRFDLRYLAVPAFVERVMMAKIDGIKGPRSIREKKRQFLRDLAEIIRAMPTGRSTAIANVKEEYDHLIETVRLHYEHEVRPVVGHLKRSEKGQALSDYLQRFIRKRNKGLVTSEEAQGQDHGSEPSHADAEKRAWSLYVFIKIHGRHVPESEVILQIARGNCPHLARKILAAKYDKTEESIRRQVYRKTPLRTRDPFADAFGFRDWTIVRKWFQKHYRGRDPLDLVRTP